MKRRLVLVLLVAACGGGGGGGDDDGVTPDASAGVDAALDAGASLDWLEDYQREVIRKLTDAEEIAPGVTLTARSSEAQRDATRAYLIDELERWGLTVETYDYGQGANVLATLPASADGDGAMVILGAHFDSVPNSPAAADDGTGVAVVLAGARYFVDVAERPRPMTFILFDQEEVGLVGSQLWSDHLVQTGANVAEVHSFDMISYDGDGDGGFELWSPSAALDTRYKAHAETAGLPVESVTFEYSDHQSFVQNGFVVTGVGEEFNGGDTTPHYHTPEDTYDKIDFPYLGGVTRVAFDVIRDQ